jgi:DNA-directed RNA polymerase subunit RPC12/RpoP
VTEPETPALDLVCAECGRTPRPGELWRLYFSDAGEVAIYCRECSAREFGESLTR